LDVSEGIDAVSIITIHKSKGLEFPVVIIPVTELNKLQLSNEKISCEVPDEIKDISGDMDYLYFTMKKELGETSLAEVYINEEDLSQTDNVNVLYVAMTRASKRLSVLCQSKSLIEKGTFPELNGNIDRLLMNVCTSHPDYDSENHRLYLNPNPDAGVEGKKEEESAIIDTKNKIECAMWRNVVTLSSPAVKLAIEQERSARDTGLLIHSILSKIETIEDVHPVIDKEVESGNIIHNEKENIQQQIERIIAHPELKRYFSNEGQILNEREIIRPDHSAYRPDRVVLFDKKAVVIDYKTGEEKKSHKKQIAEYGVLLKEMGYDVEREILIYIGDDLTVEVVENR
jgi:ATP-dependent exoDNAse (exonuclease V) beta subunit